MSGMRSWFCCEFTYNVISGDKKRQENYEARLVFRNVSSKLN
jgi:hypothetical protein